MVVGRLDPFAARKGPQRRLQRQQIAAEGCGLGIRTGA
jgi:hypothetical protein